MTCLEIRLYFFIGLWGYLSWHIHKIFFLNLTIQFSDKNFNLRFASLRKTNDLDYDSITLLPKTTQ